MFVYVTSTELTASAFTTIPAALKWFESQSYIGIFPTFPVTIPHEPTRRDIGVYDANNKMIGWIKKVQL